MRQRGSKAHRRFIPALVFLFTLSNLLPNSVGCKENHSASLQTAPAGTRGVEIQPVLAEGLPIALVYIHLEKSTGDPIRDDEFKRKVFDALGIAAGGLFRPIVAEMVLKSRRLGSPHKPCTRQIVGGLRYTRSGKGRSP